MNFSVWWPWLVWVVTGAAVAAAVAAAAHVVLNKRDVRAAIGWTGLIVANPAIGSIAYYLFGINRIRRRAARIVAGREGNGAAAAADASAPLPDLVLPPTGETIARILAGTSVRTHLRPGNSIEMLVQGDVAYPAMLDAIRKARRSVALATYILDNDAAGAMFADALEECVRRGVDVRVLIDGVGARYSRPRMTRVLRARGIRCAEFLPTRMPWPSAYMNLRNHRKLLVVDGTRAFAGGMNIREGCLLQNEPADPVQDVHFGFSGPIVRQLFGIFHEDWQFATGERLEGEAWALTTEGAGKAVCRAIADGPDEDFETLRWAMLAGISAARSSIRIVTPYFLPEQPMIASLQLAALRGVAVDIVLPERNNLRVVQWAATAQLWQLMEPGCRVWLTPPPFDHSKVLVVDEQWSLVGSANWDPRSLRLNFEVGVECHDPGFAAELARWVDGRIDVARTTSIDEVEERSVGIRLRDGVARLFAPYL